MNDKKWEIKFVDDGEWHSIFNGIESSGKGFYEITFDGDIYGVIGKDAWDKKSTGQILAFVEGMLNDVHKLALRDKFGVHTGI